MMEPRHSVQIALDLLAARLDLLLATRLKQVLRGLPWTAILEQLDQAKGFVSKTYRAGDLQPQLRMITEKLGNLGYPFDTGNRLVSTLGNELRIVRNRWAHNDDFTALDAWRTHDFVYRLLEQFGDEQGLGKAKSGRLAALVAATKEEGISPQDVEAKVSAPAIEAEPSTKVEESSEYVAPTPQVLVRADDRSTQIIGNARSEFEPWVPIAVDDTSVLDELPKKAAKLKVRALAVEIAEFEGPIHIDRLASLIAQSFGLHRLHPARQKKIIYQIKVTDGLKVDGDKFVWPSTIDPEKWAEFRPNDSDADRPFLHISPVEIANAARFLAVDDPTLTKDDLETAVLQTFGRKRRTKQLAEHLALAQDRR